MGARSSEQLPASANRSSCRAGSEAPSLTARIRRRHTKVALSALRARGGTEGSNPFPPESPRLTQTRPLQVENRGFRAACAARLAAPSAEERLALVQPGIVVLGQVRVCDSQWARMLILCARAESTGSAKQAAGAGPFTWAGRSRSASKTSKKSDNRPSEKDHPEPAIGSRRVRASGNAAAQRAAIAQNPCAPKRSKIGPQASVRRAVAVPMPTVP